MIISSIVILISIFGIVIGWIIYDQICKHTVNNNLNILAIFILFVFANSSAARREQLAVMGEEFISAAN